MIRVMACLYLGRREGVCITCWTFYRSVLREDAYRLHFVDELRTGIGVREGDPDLENRFRGRFVATVDRAAAEEYVLVDVPHEELREVLPLAVDESIDASLDPFHKPCLVLFDDFRHGICMGYAG